MTEPKQFNFGVNFSLFFMMPEYWIRSILYLQNGLSKVYKQELLVVSLKLDFCGLILLQKLNIVICIFSWQILNLNYC